MLKWLKRGIAKYDRWCERLGLVPENRRSCAPVRYDDDDPRNPSMRRHSRQRPDDKPPQSTACSLQNEKT